MYARLLVLSASALCAWAQSSRDATSESDSSMAMTTSSASVGFSSAFGSFSTTTRDTVDAQTTLNLLLDAGSDQAFVGSIIDVNCDTTRIALACTAGDYGEGFLSTTCGLNQPEGTYTVMGSSSLAFSSQVSEAAAEITVVEDCTLVSDDEAALCTGFGGFSYDGETEVQSFTTTLSPAPLFQVPITGGMEALETGSCTQGGSGGDSEEGEDVPSQSEGAAARPTAGAWAGSEVVKVLVVPGFAVAAVAGWL